eukprot:gi/632979714/ref/XP_007906623.1/ PREDICTED: hormonally up-regulated neu tumor-associated kinase-like [Callorhinchus milii]
MPAAVSSAPDGILIETGNTEHVLSEWDKANQGPQVPECFIKLPQDLAKSFPHTKRVGSYLVGKMINKGSFAKVMEGLHIPTGEKVAIKVIDKKKAKQDSYVLKNMKREPRIHQMVRHPNIVQLFETLETENSYYMVMELCLGGDLMERICDKKKLEEREVRRYTRQILSAVEHLHRHAVVHRDLKIENFLLDENNNIKIVDFGLSNTLKIDSQEMLTTQCGSPAYAAPELLAHKKYGPKVDVWSIGVSMFAMLTGTLPFTVEPFNIKQLHQKMVNGDISSIPPEISSGGLHFMLCLLEPDPVKRPTVREVMEEKWLSEGFVRRSLHSVVYKNRLHPDELNSSVLNFMTEKLGFGLTEIMNTLINNRPSPIMATYCLLLKRLARYQNGIKNKNQASSGSQGRAEITHSPIDANQEFQEQNNPIIGDDPVQPVSQQSTEGNLKSIMVSKGTPRSLLENKGHCKSPIVHHETEFKCLLQAMEDYTRTPNWKSQEKDGHNFVVIDTPQLSPLPKLRQVAFKDSVAKKTTWIRTSRHSTNGSPPFLVSGIRPSFLPPSRQQALIVKSLRQSKEKTQTCLTGNSFKKNSIQLKPTQKAADLNLPVLSPVFQSKSDKKHEIIRLDFV